MTTLTTEKSQQTIELLKRAYRMELETVANYLANSIHLEGMRADVIKQSLAEDVGEELQHARRLGERIKQLRGRVPGSLEFQFDQESLRPPEDPTDLASIVCGVIDAETEAIEHYQRMIEHAEESNDHVTADLATQLLAEEESHRSLFLGFQAELKCCS